MPSPPRQIKQTLLPGASEPIPDVPAKQPIRPRRRRNIEPADPTQRLLPGASRPAPATAKRRKRPEQQLAPNLKDPTLPLFFGPTDKKRAKILTHVTRAQEAATAAAVIIPFRSDGGGNGAYFDHRTMQSHGSETVMLHDEAKSHRVFLEHLRTVTHPLNGEEDAESGQVVPRHIQHADMVVEHHGLLVLPGMSRRRREDSALEHERWGYIKPIIQQALREGRPILAICGGLWDLWESVGGMLTEVHGHAYRGGMPRVKDSTGKIGHNKMVHRIKLTPGTLLYDAMGQPDLDYLPAVNSVHWLAIDPSRPTRADEHFMIAATAVHDSTLVPKKRDTGEPALLPEADSVEGIASHHGAPIIGTQWHPEAFSKITPQEYTPRHHIDLIHYMIQAGNAFHHKKRMIKALKAHISTEENASHHLQPTVLKMPKHHHVFGARIEENSVVTRASSKVRRDKKEIKYTHYHECKRLLLWQRAYKREEHRYPQQAVRP